MEKEVILKTKTKNVIKILGIQRAVKNLVPIFQKPFYHVNERVSVIELRINGAIRKHEFIETVYIS